LKPFDRKNPPPWMQLGQTGLDDKREPNMSGGGLPWPTRVWPSRSEADAMAADVYIHPDKWVTVVKKTRYEGWLTCGPALSLLRSRRPKSFQPVSERLPSSRPRTLDLTDWAVGNFGAGYTMRFPRCKFIYYDKASRDHPLSDDSLDRDQWTVVGRFGRGLRACTDMSL
jgi:hypothetical protein